MTLLSLARHSLLFLLAAGLVSYLVLASPSAARSESPMNIFGFGFRSQPGTHTTPPAKRDPSTPRYSASAYDITPLTDARVQELARKLTPDEAKVILRAGTEPAFCGNLTDNKLDGVYVCRLCGLPLFKSDSKFHSGTGWPSFFQPVDPAHIDQIADDSLGMDRTEILCTRCHAHLGHVFDDGPKPTGLRYCVNSVSLEFIENGKPLPAASQPIKTETAYFAGGCFWGTEDLFQQVPGVIDAVSGYMGGTLAKPTYDKVCEHNTGHAETVKIVYDPARITYETLLADFFKFHNPTTLNRQGPDVGDQYRSAIFATDDAQLKAANAYIAKLQATDKYKSRKIVTVVQPAAKDGQPGGFWKAEDYHQDYHMKHGGHCAMPEE